MSRSIRRVLLALSGALLVVALLPSPAALADSFYQPPDPLPAGAPGDLVRSRVSDNPPTRGKAKAWQVMYLSTNALGQRHAVTGTVLVPTHVDPRTAPVVGLAVGTHGPAFRCTPSTMVEVGALYEQPAVNDLLARGYAVAITDYEGYTPEPRTTYIVGRSMGAAVIDVVRAALRLPATGLSANAKVAFRGYSQGGGAAMWAGETQPGYAPELNLVGVVGGGVPADLIQVALPLEGKPGYGVLAYALMGLDQAYPELKLNDYLNDKGRTEFARMRREACTFELLTWYPKGKLSDHTTSSPVLTPQWLARVRENKLGTKKIPVPVFQYHAENDELVHLPQAKELFADYCRLGVNARWQGYPSDHITLVYTGNEAAHRFLADRFAGVPATSGC
ncbi:lipase family protein [Crossiella cryophila]|uniref:Pimeloyl-ACP methyl ester carboxylesterase n=1 Tax=Crossiella cryophila TaxID=43355 RepID=A0A7W7CD55_9PSEU|nr:lipase family protein [Crossiella cryophila]MBB4678985.1 pimeloyl-ACP methyl ester carboxylesterase [Crossiella cryophila]